MFSRNVLAYKGVECLISSINSDLCHHSVACACISVCLKYTWFVSGPANIPDLGKSPGKRILFIHVNRCLTDFWGYYVSLNISFSGNLVA